MRRALYRKYRPRTLSEVIGQKHITDALEKSLKSDKISHAYLFIGPRGTGKTSVARILAHEINKFAYELEDDHLDIVEIDAASNTGVDNIRNLREKALIAPSRGEYKIYIIDEVHMLSKSAFNALLKTLEEPPAHVVFIMATTDAHKVPITITSRSQTFTFKLADSNTMTEHLESIAKAENIKIAPDAIKIVAKHGKGSFRDSLSLLDQISTISTGEITCALLEDALGLPSDELIAKLLETYLLGDLTCACSTLQNLLDQGVKPEVLAEELMTNIVSNPKPELLPLLHKLTDVPHSGYPEVKLLLALANPPKETVSPFRLTTESPKVLPSGEAVEKMAAGHLVPADRSSLHPVKTGVHAKGPLQKADLQTRSTQPSPVTSWQEFCEAIKKDNAAIFSLLTKTTAEMTTESLKIFSKNSMIRNKLKTKLNYLATFLPENTIIEILDQKPSTDPVINDLSSIFGAVEDVKLDDIEEKVK